MASCFFSPPSCALWRFDLRAFVRLEGIVSCHDCFLCYLSCSAFRVPMVRPTRALVTVQSDSAELLAVEFPLDEEHANGNNDCLRGLGRPCARCPRFWKRKGGPRFAVLCCAAICLVRM